MLDEPKEHDLVIADRELEWSTTRGSGAGGQNRNKVETVAVVRHKPSGLMVRCESERSQYRNKCLAMRLLRAKLNDRMQNALHGAEAEIRKSQVGSGQRGDKRRTIRVKDGQVKDHITGRSWPLARYLAGEW